MPPDAPKLDFVLAHGHFSADCFNRAWTLIEKPDRDAADDEQMLLLALSSLWHWTQREDCTNRNLSIGHWQVSRIYALLGDGNAARKHGERCLALAQGSPPFYLAYAHEAMARAAFVASDVKTAQQHLAEARTITESVSDPEERRLLEPDLDSLANEVA